MRNDLDFDFFNALRFHTMDDMVEIAGVKRPRLTLLLHTDKPLGTLASQGQSRVENRLRQHRTATDFDDHTVRTASIDGHRL